MQQITTDWEGEHQDKAWPKAKLKPSSILTMPCCSDSRKIARFFTYNMSIIRSPESKTQVQSKNSHRQIKAKLKWNESKADMYKNIFSTGTKK